MIKQMPPKEHKLSYTINTDFRDLQAELYSPVLTSDASISTSISISIKDAYALVRTATT